MGRGEREQEGAEGRAWQPPEGNYPSLEVLQNLPELGYLGGGRERMFWTCLPCPA